MNDDRAGPSQRSFTPAQQIESSNDTVDGTDASFLPPTQHTKPATSPSNVTEELSPIQQNLVPETMLAAPDAINQRGSRYYVRLGQKVCDIKPDAMIQSKQIVIAEVGAENRDYAYFYIPAWVVNGVQIGSWASMDEIVDIGEAIAEFQFVPDSRFENQFDVGALEKELGTLRKKRNNLPQGLLAPPVKFTKASQSWMTLCDQAQLGPGMIGCIVEIVNRTLLQDLYSNVDNQQIFDMNSSYEDVMAYARSIAAGMDGSDTVGARVSKTSYKLVLLWVLPQKFDGQIYK